MFIISLLLIFAGLYLVYRTFRESRLTDGLIMEVQVYTALYGFGAFLILAGLGLPLLCGAFRRFLLLRILTLAAAAALLILLLTAGHILTVPLTVSPADGSEAFLLVPGAPVVNGVPTAALRSRAEAAAQWMKAHPETAAVISGGKGGQMTEAQTIAELILRAGIGRERLILENKAVSTDENFRFARKLLESRTDLSREPLVIVTSTFHICRLRYYAKRSGFGNIRFLPAPTPPSVRLLWYAREVILMIRYRLLGL